MALLAIKERNKNTSLERTYQEVIRDKDTQLNTLQIDKEILFRRNKSLDNEVSDLTSANDHLRENRLIYRNLLKENGYELTELTKMPHLKGNLVILFSHSRSLDFLETTKKRQTG